MSTLDKLREMKSSVNTPRNKNTNLSYMTVTNSPRNNSAIFNGISNSPQKNYFSSSSPDKCKFI